MAQQMIDTEGTDDTLQSGFEKVNANFSEVYDALDAKADLVDGKVPEAQLPSYVDDVIEAANFAALPESGESGKIYVTLDADKTFRWSGSAYIEISQTPAIADQSAAETGTDNTALMTPLRTAQAIAALASGGGGMPDLTIGWCDTARGSDTTGDGSMSKPYAAAQKAYDEGFRRIALIGTDVGAVIGTALNLELIGFGKGVSVFGQIFGTSGNIKGNGADAVSCGDILVAAARGADGEASTAPGVAGGGGTTGSDAPNVTVEGITFASCILLGGAGGNGARGYDGDEVTNGSAGGSGAPGGAGGTLTINHCHSSGYAYSAAGPSGNSGNAGANSGFGQDVGADGPAGNSSSGTVNVNFSQLSSYVGAPGAAGGAHGTGNPDGSDGAAGSAGTVNSKQSAHATGDGTLNKIASIIDGSFYAS